MKSIFSSLSHNQKETAILLQIGTFLEYFDLMLYVHMAVLLNEAFFPKTDPQTASLLAAFAFCSTYVLRPFGALIFGYIGDTIGRKAIIVITTIMMSFSCIIMAVLPTYAQIGITSAWMITICRIFQGLSSMGEVIGAEIYLTEITSPPARYPIVSLIAAFSVFGGMCALAAATFIVSTNSNWRLVFWVGASIAILGSIARTKFQETKEFLAAKRKGRDKYNHHSGQKSVSIKKTLMAYFFIFCPWPLFFYLSYIFYGDILKNQFGYTTEQVIQQNLLVTLVDFITIIPIALISYKIYPLKILKLRSFLNLIFIICLPYALISAKSPYFVFILQVLTITFGLSPHPGFGVFYAHFPVLKRFTYATFLYALTRAIMYIVTSFGLFLITEKFGYYGLWLLMIPLAVGFSWGVNYFEKLDNKEHLWVSKI